MINFYSANIESEQIQTFNELNILISNLDLNSEKRIIFAGDFNLFLDRSLDAKGGSPSLKKHSLSKLLEIKQKLNLCNIWRVINPKQIQYTFRQQYFSGLIQRRLDCIFTSQNFREVVKDSEILCTYQLIIQLFFVLFNISINLESRKDLSLWKFHNSLVSNEDLIQKCT